MNYTAALVEHGYMAKCSLSRTSRGCIMLNVIYIGYSHIVISNSSIELGGLVKKSYTCIL